MTKPRGISAIDARNGCYGNEEATADDGVTESGMYSQKGDCPHVGVSALPSDAKGNPRFSQQAPTEAERAVDKVLAAHRLQEAVMDLNRASERARLFRESIVKFVPEFSYLVKQDGDPNHAPHNCINELSAQLVCGICGAKYVGRTTAERIGG